MDGLPRVSVVIPTYNRAEMLHAALESVLAQTTPAQDIIVVDDGSTDGTPGIIRQLQAKGAPIIYLREGHTNRRGEARNKGAQAGAGDLIAFLDSDDLWKPERLERQLEALTKSPEAGFAFCKLQRFGRGGPIDPPYPASPRDYNGHILGELLEEPLVISSTLVVKREAFTEVGGFADLRMNEDYELTLRLAARYKASYVPDVLVLMREHSGRTSYSEHETPLLDYMTIVEHFMEERPGLPLQTRASARKGLANVHLKLARLYLRDGDRVTARKHILALMKLRPWDRRALLACLRMWLAGIRDRGSVTKV